MAAAVEMVEVIGVRMMRRLAEKLNIPADASACAEGPCWGWNASKRNASGRPQF